ncbi:acyltransferase [Chitinophaga sancti]|uniref:acyltransferase family protein n=1 Tax=Chitinophaga sancti TaxID=1004 RepID=UPI002A74A859|nr:acyltransferase [Chitinophaga sancti]WPQ63316.1 acyltransferase [Chitinophaga sancti]
MGIFNVYLFFVVITIAAITLFLFNKIIKVKLPDRSYNSIDGLRGYLALGVVFHHFMIWYVFLITAKWTYPPSRFYNHLGPTSVSLFFMITAFLFFTKIRTSKGEIDWLKLYIGRVLRIYPLYVCVAVTIMVIVMIETGWKLNEPFGILLIRFVELFFFGQQDINGYPLTRFIVARVIWSLAFEWVFYLSLPVWALLIFRKKVSYFVLFLCILGLLVFLFVIYTHYPAGILRRMCPFLGGIAASYISQRESVIKVAKTKYVSVLILVLFFIAIYFFDNAYSIIPFLCIALSFIAIAAGNDLFGILSIKPSLLLGQISYSIYLIHGIFLFIGLWCLPSLREIAMASASNYWIFITCTTILIVLASSLTYKFIEAPFISATPAVFRKVNSFLKAKLAY